MKKTKTYCDFCKEKKRTNDVFLRVTFYEEDAKIQRTISLCDYCLEKLRIFLEKQLNEKEI